MAKRQSRATGSTGKPSIADVAAIANVSTQTVSRVLAGSENVRPATRTVVLDAIRQVDYHPNTAARRLASGRTRTIGLVTVDTVAHSRSAIAHGIADAARAADYEVATATVDRLAPLFVARAIRQLVSQGIDGLVLAVPMRTPDQSALEVLETLPTVALAGEPAHYYDLIAVDQHKAGTLATEHLLGLGHHNVWHVSGPQDWAETVGRTAGWSDALTAAGIEPPPVLPGDWTPASGYECGRLLANMADVSAVFVASDEMAFGVMQALRENGLAVPDDVSIVAMDDIPLAPYAPTPLTTVRQAFEEIAERVVARLLELLDGDSEPAGEPRLIEPQLIVRASTKRR